jgi:hypothetical protein
LHRIADRQTSYIIPFIYRQKHTIELLRHIANIVNQPKAVSVIAFALNREESIKIAFF